MTKKRATRMEKTRKNSAPELAFPSAVKSTNTGSKAAWHGGYALWPAICCATLLAYLPAIRGSPVWDDSSHLTSPELQSLHGLWRIWCDLGATQQYYPLLHTAFWLEHRLWGDAVVGYHLTNIILHAMSACLVVSIMRRLSLPGAWLAGFAFALHPVCVEAVAWISEQKSTLSGVFCLAALLTYLHFNENRRASWYWLATGLFLLALLSKTVTAMLPAIILVIFWWRNGRIEWKRDTLPLIPWFAVATMAGLFTSWMERTYIGATGAEFLLTPLQRLLIASRDIFFYAGKLLWPANLAFFYPHWNVDANVWWQWSYPLAIVALTTGLVVAAGRARGPLASLLVFSLALFPVLGFLNVYPFRYSYVADHFQYLASLGLIIPSVAWLTRATKPMRLTESATVLCSVLLIGVLGALTWRQSGMYRDAETLYRKSLEHNPDSVIAHRNLGVLLADRPGELPNAIEEYDAALKIDPHDPEVLYNLGVAYGRSRGRLQDAIVAYRAALLVRPDYPEAHNNLGTALARIPGRENDAIAEYEAAIRSYPDFVDAHYNLGNLLARIPHRQPEAIAQYQAAIKISPNCAKCHFNLGNVLLGIPGCLLDARTEYWATVRIKPDFAEAHNNLGLVLAQIPGHLTQSLLEYETALKIAPNLADAHFNLGNALALMPGHSQDAIAEYEMAAQINPSYSAFVRTRIRQINAGISRQGKVQAAR